MSESTLNQKRNELLKLLYDVLGDILTSSGSIVTALSDVSTETTLSSVDNLLLDSLGGNGTYYRGGTGAHTGDAFKYIVINEDAVITTLTGDASTNFVSALGISGVTLSKGMIIKGVGGELIEDITLASGSIIGVV